MVPAPRGYSVSDGEVHDHNSWKCLQTMSNFITHVMLHYKASVLFTGVRRVERNRPDKS